MKKPSQARAYKLAGSKCTGDTLIVEACKTINKPQCQAYLQKLADKATKNTLKTAEDVIREIEKLAFSKKRDIIKLRSLEILAKKFNLIKEGGGVVVHGNIIFNENRPAPKSTKAKGGKCLTG